MSNKFDGEIYKYLKCEFWVFEINFEKTKIWIFQKNYLNIKEKIQSTYKYSNY